MLDAPVMRALSAPLNVLGQQLAKTGLRANHLTAVGFLAGMVCCIAITQQSWLFAGLCFGLNRLCDGLDGALARATSPTDLGGYFDIVADFLFYGGFVCAFAVADPANGLPASVLLVTFLGTGSSFLAFAILAEKHGVRSEARGKKSFFYLGGLAEGTETAIVFAAMLIWPDQFGLFAYGFATVCTLTVIGRVRMAVKEFGKGA